VDACLRPGLIIRFSVLSQTPQIHCRAVDLGCADGASIQVGPNALAAHCLNH